MGLLNPAIKGYFRLRYSGIENFIHYPHESQMKVFNDLIANGQYTDYGRVYQFGAINNVADFKKLVPIVEYEDLLESINRTLNGDEDVLWNTKITWFAKSSGTSNDKSKFIPVSKEALEDCHFKAGMDVLAMYYNCNTKSELFNGKGLALGGSHQINQLNAESFYGDLSAVMLQNMSGLASYMNSLDLEVALMTEWEEKINKMAQYTITEPITFIAGVPTWTVVLIRKIFEITGKNNLRDVWPGLELYIHGGVNFDPYRNQFNELIRGAGMNYLETYNASEGFFAAQDDLKEDGMLLFLGHGIYYEFMPLSEYGSPSPKTLSLQEVELNTQYAMVISTNAGLWRYLIGDTIEFVNLKPYKIKVRGRLKAFINCVGEELMVDSADRALAIACEETDAIIADYTAGPIYFSGNESAGHEWLIEFERVPNNQEKFNITLDTQLRQLNSDYDAKRYKSMALAFPKIHVVAKGTFNEWLKSKGRLGGQHKVPRLCNDRRVLDEIITDKVRSNVTSSIQ
jgi:hypothetical protein